MQVNPVLDRPVPYGPRAYRRRLRVLGPLVGLIPPAVLALLSLALRRGNQSATRGVVGFAAALLASPCIALAGMPLNDGRAAWYASTAGSVLVWLLVGVVAARRATRSPVASWPDFWREYLWPAAGLWLGSIGAFLIADLVLGRALF